MRRLGLGAWRLAEFLFDGGRGVGMGLDQPFGGVGLADPYRGGVVVVVLHLGFVFGATVKCVEYVVGGEGGIRREDANLQVTEFIGLELTVLEGNQQGVDGLDSSVDLDEVSGEEAANRSEVAFGHGGPEMLF